MHRFLLPQQFCRKPNSFMAAVTRVVLKLGTIVLLGTHCATVFIFELLSTTTQAFGFSQL